MRVAHYGKIADVGSFVDLHERLLTANLSKYFYTKRNAIACCWIALPVCGRRINSSNPARITGQ